MYILYSQIALHAALPDSTAYGDYREDSGGKASLHMLHMRFAHELVYPYLFRVGSGAGGSGTAAGSTLTPSTPYEPNTTSTPARLSPQQSDPSAFILAAVSPPGMNALQGPNKSLDPNVPLQPPISLVTPSARLRGPLQSGLVHRREWLKSQIATVMTIAKLPRLLTGLYGRNGTSGSSLGWPSTTSITGRRLFMHSAVSSSASTIAAHLMNLLNHALSFLPNVAPSGAGIWKGLTVFLMLALPLVTCRIHASTGPAVPSTSPTSLESR